MVIVTPGGATVQGTDTAESCGGCGTALAVSGETSARGCGRGIPAVAQYQGNPVQTALDGAVQS